MQPLSRAVGLLCIALLLPGVAGAETNPYFATSTVTAGVGATLPTGGFARSSHRAGPAVTAEYEFALYRFLAITLGVENFFPETNGAFRFDGAEVRERFTLMPLSLRGILPLAAGGAELFIGSGAARRWTTDPTFGGPFSKKVLWHNNGGFRIALDSDRRFHIGPTVRMYRELGRPHQVWLSVTGQLSYRFGR